MEFEILKGKTIKKIIRQESALIFYISDTEIYKMCHEQHCCETVEIEDICGDLEWLIDSPILRAESRSSATRNEWDSDTWTFYEISTIKGSVTIRWHGSSNGYYSEDVDFIRIL